MDGVQVAAPDTRQHGLPGDAQGNGGDLDGDPADGGVVGDEVPDGLGEADAPGGAGGDLLAGDESVVEPPVEGGCRYAELGGGLVHAHRLAVRVRGVPAVAGGRPWRLRMVATLASIPGQVIELRLPRAGDHRGRNRNRRVRPSHQGMGTSRSANPGRAAARPSGARWRWSSRTGGRPRWRACRRRSRRAALHTGAGTRQRG